MKAARLSRARNLCTPILRSWSGQSNAAPLTAFILSIWSKSWAKIKLNQLWLFCQTKAWRSTGIEGNLYFKIDSSDSKFWLHEPRLCDVTALIWLYVMPFFCCHMTKTGEISFWEVTQTLEDPEFKCLVQRWILLGITDTVAKPVGQNKFWRWVVNRLNRSVASPLCLIQNVLTLLAMYSEQFVSIS